MTDITFSNFIYLDTNIYSYLAKNKNILSHFYNFLIENDLCLALSNSNLAELADAESLHEDLVDLLLCMPSSAIKTWDDILNEEVKAYPKCRNKSLFLYRFDQLAIKEKGRDTLLGWFKSNKLVKARKEQLQCAKQMQSRHSSLKDNFPPSNSGKYTWKQSIDFAIFMVTQWLIGTHYDFIALFEDRMQDLNTDVFLSVRLFALVIFYKYYLGRREPDKLSDFGDLSHLYSIPYCKLAVMERDLCNILKQIKQHHNVLNSTEVQNINFFSDWL